MDEAKLRQLAEWYQHDDQSQAQLRMFLGRAEDARRTLSVPDMGGLSEPDVVRVFGGLNAYGDELIAREAINKRGLQHARDYLRRVVELAPIDFGPEQLRDLVSTPGFGASVATELLGALEPSRHWHLNDTVKRGLRRISVDLTPTGLPKSGVEVHRYFALKPQMEAIRDILSEVFGRAVDFYGTTRFLIEIGRGYTNSDDASVRYWKVSPGQSASHWEVLREQGCIGIGGNEIGDLSEIGSSSEADLREYYEGLDTRTDHSWEPRHAAHLYWALLHEMSEGDRIVAYGGKTILDVGTVTGEYYHDDDADAYPHRRPVNWDGIGPLQVDTLPPDVGKRLQYYSTMFEITEQQYRAIMDASVGKPPIAEPIQVIQTHLSARGFHFSDWDVASFYTALQTKGFVILSGISGTGKTKLAQEFAAMLPGALDSTHDAGDVLTTTVQPYMLRYSRLCIPKHASAFIEWPGPDEKRRVMVKIGDAEGDGPLAPYGRENALVLGLNRDVRQEFAKRFREGDTVAIDIGTDEDGRPQSIELRAASDVQAIATSDSTDSVNSLFIPVRPDWRDSKSLLGYYNPLTQEYNWTDFLRFVMRAHRNYSSDKEPTIAWFVILDEMNLARVEYYFADLLSVLESGRDDAGWTREALRCEYVEDPLADVPPREIHLPPNLYVIGTVNVDETTHAFSPKVLDRAFTIRMTDVDFRDYPPGSSDEVDLSASDKPALLDQFTRRDRFTVIDKSRIAEFVAGNPEVRDRLQELNRHLRVYDMHFGYRVFDEIVSFLEAAEQSSSFDDLDGALDAAVLMKVLPKFHGSRGKLEGPLVALYAWCVDPDEAEASSLQAEIEGLGSEVDVIRMLAAKDIVYEKTAQRVRQMLRDLYTDGFTAFG